ncbi:hypothetical protein ACH5RR_036146 [Cinchona calisaya]|uniref:non-specific serine/threonine protein kinase n=1 Tax=Cinchona calisaya TaxID=153742 RepID=A0ABD2Y5J7_9GENT
MTRDSNDPSRRKHRRSPSDDENNDSEAPSKRRKHHHHKHHQHHHHRSKKEAKVEGATQTEVEIEEKREEETEVSTVGATGAVFSGSILGINYDMEEGEILEEDEAGGGADGTDGGQVKRKELGSDVETGEIDPQRGNSDTSYMAGDASREGKKPNSCLLSKETMDEEDGKLRAASEFRINKKYDSSLFRTKYNDLSRERTSWYEHASNGDIVHDYLKDDLPVEDRRQIYDEESVSRESKELLAEGEGKSHRGLSRSPSRDRHHDEVRSRTHLKSPDHSRGRSRSQSILQEGSSPDKPKVHNYAYYSKRKHMSDLDDEPVNESSRDYENASRESVRDREMGHDSSYNRHIGRLDRHHSRETHERDREGSRDVDRDRKRERERERTIEKERERERERAREREREKEREGEKGRERRRDWEREKERERRNWDRESSRDRNRDRESSRDRNRDRDRDRDGERYSKHSKFNDNDAYGDQDRYADYRRRRHEETNQKDWLNDGSKKNLSERESEKSRRDENEQDDYQEKIVLQLAEQEDDLERIKEECRRRRQAILEKYRSQKSQQQPEAQLERTVKEQIELPSVMVPSVNIVPEPTNSRNEGSDGDVADPSFSVGKSPPLYGVSTFEKPSDTGALGAGTPKSERSDDMFCDDIFGDSPASVRKTGKVEGLAIERSGLHDNWDDAEGYYSYRLGEILDGWYEIIAAQGKGVFSTVVRAKDLKAKSGESDEVAIKIIRNNETMLKAGNEELVILKKLVGADPEDKHRCVRFLSSFKYRNHLCLVFESLHMNLREVLKKFGRNIGLKLTAVRAYTKQLFIALKHLRNCGVLHCDIKPDNMLVNEAKNVLKLCDFGNAMFAGKNEITPYLVSRFYRAPEIILGLPYDHPMDMWSVGCCLFELYSGKVLFPGPTNNDMLRLHMELKGAFPKKMVRKAAFKDHHFDQGLNFLATEEDPVTKKAVRRAILNVKPKDFGTLILGSPGEDPKMLANFKDLLEKIFMLDPDKRITVSQALSHPFITGK